MTMLTRIYLILCILCVVSVSLLAQDDFCPTLVESALGNVADSCVEVGRNQVCYGNIQLDVELVEDSEIIFDTPGDIADVIAIKSLSLSSLQAPDEWGIALMKIQANLPDTVPGQNVTMLLFGDVEIENEADSSDDNDQFNPMQAVVFKSGVGELGCEEAPPDGILIQTPSGMGTVTLNMNRVLIELGSTAFLNAVPDDKMQITMLEGEAIVTASGVTVTVPAGLRAEIPLDEDGLASGSPEVVEFEADDIMTLPLGNLDIPIELPDPLPLSALDTDEPLTDGGFLIPEQGMWCNANDPSAECGDLVELISDINEEGMTSPLAGFIPRVDDNIYALDNFEYSGIVFDVLVEILSTTEIRITLYDYGNDSTTVDTLIVETNL
jgi:hypothetical protein